MKHACALAMVPLLVLASTAQAQALGQGGSEVTISPWRVIASLALCLALGATAIYALRRRFGLGGDSLHKGLLGKRIRLVEQQYLGPQRSICLVEIDGKTYAALFAPQAAALVPLGGEAPADGPDVAGGDAVGGDALR